MADTLYAAPRTPVADIETNETNIRVEYHLKYWDYLLFVCLHQFFSIPLQAVNFLFGVLFYLAFSGGRVNISTLVAAIVAYGFLWAIQFAFNVLYFWSKKNRSILTHHVVEIQDGGFYEETRYNRSLHFWNGGVAKVASRFGYVAVYTAAHNAHVIPARAFANAAHRSGFLATVRGKIKTQASGD